MEHPKLFSKKTWDDRLVVSTQFETYESKMGSSSPNRAENKKMLESHHLVLDVFNVNHFQNIIYKQTSPIF